MKQFLSGIVGKVLGGAAAVFGGPLKLFLGLLIDRLFAAVVKYGLALIDYFKEQQTRSNEEAKRKKVVAAYKAALKTAKTPAEREKAFDEYQEALRGLSS